MSIGSEISGGASAICVSDLSIDGSDNGMRIKSNITRDGLVHDVHFEDVYICDTATPVLMETHYPAIVSPDHDRQATLSRHRGSQCMRRGRRQGDARRAGRRGSARLGIQFDNVWFDQPAKIKVSSRHSEIQAGPGSFSLDIAGDDVRVTCVTGAAAEKCLRGKVR